jgi:hypothetical protein
MYVDVIKRLNVCMHLGTFYNLVTSKVLKKFALNKEQRFELFYEKYIHESFTSEFWTKFYPEFMTKFYPKNTYLHRRFYLTIMDKKVMG